ncbi:MAG TPA: glycosyltransferase family 1 protein [Acidimicrobiia bacterium]|nr:glycosyltransferase family 1 protein [Acidimicrobiia bacterium]
MSERLGFRVGLHVGQMLQRIPGGIGRYLGVLARCLSEEGLDVVPFAAGPRPAALADTDSYVDLGRPHGSVRYELWHHFRRPALALDVDVVHAPSLAVPPTGSTPLVVTVHDLAFLRLPQYFTIRGLRFHERGLRLAREHAAAVIVPSDFVAGELIAEGFAADRVHVAHHGIDDPGDRPPLGVSSVAERLGLTSRYVLFVGTLEPRKGIDTLIEGFRLLRRTAPDLQLALVGPRGWGKLPRLDRPGVVQVGQITDDDLDALYRGALALAYPSEYEGFGLPALEAMVRGCPVVTSAATSLPEVVGDAGRLVPTQDPGALSAALAEIIDDPAERERLGAAGRERAQQFTWGASVQAHVAAYRVAAGRSS